jgi:hypothetical protein
VLAVGVAAAIVPITTLTGTALTLVSAIVVALPDRRP